MEAALQVWRYSNFQRRYCYCRQLCSKLYRIRASCLADSNCLFAWSIALLCLEDVSYTQKSWRVTRPEVEISPASERAHRDLSSDAAAAPAEGRDIARQVKPAYLSSDDDKYARAGLAEINDRLHALYSALGPPQVGDVD